MFTYYPANNFLFACHLKMVVIKPSESSVPIICHHLCNVTVGNYSHLKPTVTNRATNLKLVILKWLI